MSRKVAVFSGTFDPIHKGHEWLVKQVLDELKFDQIIVLVEPEPRRKTPVASLEDRVAMVEKCLSEDARIRVNPFDATGSHTIKSTLNKIQKFSEGAEISLVMGGDVFEFVPLWQGIESAINDVSFIVALRTEDDGEIAVNIMGDTMKDARVKLIASDESGVSSSVIRRNLNNGEHSNHINAAVVEYIKEHNLYNEQ